MLIDEIWNKQMLKVNKDLNLYKLMRVNSKTLEQIKSEYRKLFQVRYTNTKIIEGYFGLLIAVDNKIDSYELF